MSDETKSELQEAADLVGEVSEVEALEGVLDATAYSLLFGVILSVSAILLAIIPVPIIPHFSFCLLSIFMFFSSYVSNQ